MFYLTTHSTHFIYGYMAPVIWLRTILIVRKETRCRHIGYSFRLAARVLLYAPSHRQDSTYHGLCYTSRGAMAGMKNSSMGPSHEGSIRRPIAPRSYISLPYKVQYAMFAEIFELLRSQIRKAPLHVSIVTRRCISVADPENPLGRVAIIWGRMPPTCSNGTL